MDLLKAMLGGAESSKKSNKSTKNGNDKSTVSTKTAESFLNDGENGEEEEETGRLSKFATCIRSVAATVPYKKKQLFNSPEFDPVEMKAVIPYMSSKFNALLETIQRLDAEDQAKHGKLFKHFIFTDLRKANVGAKAIGSFLAAHGFDVLFKAVSSQRRRKQKDGSYKMVPVKKLKVVLQDYVPTEGGSNRVGLLQSSPMWKSQLGVDVRKKMLQIFNSRPDNIHGEHIRFMVLDSKFKEGIDLYDVKYVHLMEPAITEADLKQAVGRATRFCGQRGLEFVPNQGWKLHVFLYESQFGEAFPFASGPSGAPENARAEIDAHTYMMAHSGLDLGLLEMTRQLTVLGIRSAVDYDLTYKINNFKMATQIHDLTDLKEAAVIAEVSPQTGGVKKVYATLKDVNMTKCMKRENKFFPFSVKDLKEAMKAAGVKVPAKADRQWLCDHTNEEIVRRMLEVQKSRLDQPAAAKTTLEPVKPTTPYETLFPAPTKPILLKDLADMPDIAEFFAAAEARAAMHQAATRMSFSNFQAFVAETYGRFAWESPVVKSACDFAPLPGRPVSFSKSQDFVRHYLTPASPYRGLLAWHSVGTGKTCTAVATATTTFEKEGYSILWVTRNSLMADVWKNMFGAVCSIPVQEHLERGKKLPAKLGSQKRLVSKLWFDPISYKSLQNALVPMKAGKFKGQISKLGKVLKERNGAADPLRKTFLIIDEVHKLLDGDLKKSEQADFELVAKAIHHSYAVSGEESCKVLLMTATPITDDPKGLFQLLNLLIADPKDRFPDIETFREKYTTEDGQITKAGQDFFQTKAKGLISYLNREFDPTAFAQPSFIKVQVPVTGSILESDKSILEKCYAEQLEEPAAIDCDVDELKEGLAEELAEVDADEDMKKKDKAEKKRTLKAAYKNRIEDCKTRMKTRKAALKNRERALGECVATRTRLRKRAYTKSQQKIVKACFTAKRSKPPRMAGEPPKFTGIAEMKRRAKSFRPARESRKASSKRSATNISVRAVRLTPSQLAEMVQE